MSALLVPPPALSEDAIRRLVVDRVDGEHRSVGMVVGITEAKRHSFVSHGYRVVRAAGLVDERTMFEIGSITKLFTAMLLSDMANRGEVRLDEPVAELLPVGTRVPLREGRAITLRDLASHYSGLPRRPTNLESEDCRCGPYAGYTAEKLYEFLASYELQRTPGHSWEYSNSLLKNPLVGTGIW